MRTLMISERSRIATTALVFILSVIALFSVLYSRSAGHARHEYTFLGDDFPEFLDVEGMRDVLMTVEESVHYPLDGPEALFDWASNNPKGYGYARIGPNNRFLCLSMGHQLHCLRMLRIALVDPDHPLSSLYHSQHCLNYIRQMVLCHPDLTLEPFDPLEKDFEVDRVGATHVCRDWSAVYAELSRNWSDWLNFTNGSLIETDI